jgi:hypothetical protein
MDLKRLPTKGRIKDVVLPVSSLSPSSYKLVYKP